MIKHVLAALFLVAATGTVALAQVAPSPAPAPTDSVDAIIAAPASYDGKHVTVSGTVKNYKQHTSKRGNDYTTFDVCQNACVSVYAHGHIQMGDGAVVIINGTFAADKQVSGYDIKNQIDADDTPGS